MSSIKEKINELLKISFRPEFLNRIDEIITFTRLDKKYINAIVKNQIEKLAERLKDRRINLEVSNEAIEFISDVGYDAQFGARPLKRAIQNYIENPLAKEILEG